MPDEKTEAERDKPWPNRIWVRQAHPSDGSSLVRRADILGRRAGGARGRWAPGTLALGARLQGGEVTQALNIIISKL